MAAAAMSVLTAAVASHGQPIGALGAAGDSLTNEYDEILVRYAKSWTQLLAERRGINMGPTAAEAGRPQGWGDIRGFGHEFNFARPGATTDALLLEGQHTMLAEAVRTHGVTHAVICASGNDVAPWNAFTYSTVYYGQWSEPRLQAFADASVANMRMAIQTVKATGAKVVLVNMPDFSVMPAVQENFPDPALRSRVRNLVMRINAGLATISGNEQIPLVNLFSLNDLLFGTPEHPRDVLDVAGVSIRLHDSGGQGELTAAFVGDRVHFGTVIQGLWANAIIGVLNSSYQTDIRPFSETELIEIVGGTLPRRPGLGTQLEGERVTEHGPTCRADVDRNGLLEPTDIFTFLDAWFAGVRQADFDESGTIAVQDILVFLGAWFAGC